VFLRGIGVENGALSNVCLLGMLFFVSEGGLNSWPCIEATDDSRNILSKTARTPNSGAPSNGTKFGGKRFDVGEIRRFCQRVVFSQERWSGARL
jgi:hypothetical protein